MRFRGTRDAGVYQSNIRQRRFVATWLDRREGQPADRHDSDFSPSHPNAMPIFRSTHALGLCKSSSGTKPGTGAGSGRRGRSQASESQPVKWFREWHDRSVAVAKKRHGLWHTICVKPHRSFPCGPTNSALCASSVWHSPAADLRIGSRLESRSEAPAMTLRHG